MFGLGGTEVLVIFVLALLLFGPRKLPEIGRTLGKTLTEFRRATLDFRVNLEREVELDKLKSETLGPLRDIVNLDGRPNDPRPSVARGTLPAVPIAVEPQSPSSPAFPDESADTPADASSVASPPREDAPRPDDN